MAWRNMMDKAMGTVGLAKVEKTQDSQYDEAKTLFKNASIEGDKIIGTILQMVTQLEQLGKATVRLGEDLNTMFVDAPRQALAEVQTISNVAHAFESLSVQFLHPRIDPHVIQLITKYQSELNRLKDVKSKRSAARKKYDVARYTLDQAVKRKETAKLSELEQEQRESKEKYQKLNDDFINSTKALVATREDTMIRPYHNLVAILSQYLMQVFTEMQKFRSTFPAQTFA